jgi:P4 family phage/plasmid primase-like protien
MNLISFIKKLQEKKEGAYHTHVGMTKSCLGKFNFGRKDMDEFFNLYCNKLNNPNIQINLGLAEKTQPTLPILIDADIKVEPKYDQVENLYTEEQLKFVIKAFQDTILDTMTDISKSDLNCVVLTKEKRPIRTQTPDGVEVTTFVKQGFHLHFPIFVDKEFQTKFIFPKVIEILKANNTFKNLGYDDSSKILDTNSLKVPWLIYGSKKDDSEPYLFSKVVDFNLEEISLNQSFKDYDIFDSREKKIDIKDNVQFYLPRLLSTFPFGRQDKKAKDTSRIVKMEKIKLDYKVEDEVETKHEKSFEAISQEIKQLERLVDMLSYDRADDYSEWTNVGLALHSVDKEEARPLWHQFSSKSEKYDEMKCDQTWNNFTRPKNGKKGYTIASIHLWAKQDSPDEYKQYMKEERDSKRQVKNKDKKLLLNKLSHFDCSKILYDIEGKNIKVINSNLFFIWDDITKIWTKTNTILNYSAQKLIDYFKEQAVHEPDSIYLKMVELVGGCNYIKSVCNFYCSNDKNITPEFQLCLNKDTYLFPLRNGKVLDFRNLEVRERTREDYFSFESNVSFDRTRKIDNAKKFIHSLSKDDEMTNFLQRLFGYCLTGDTSNRSLYILFGEGRNGKSTLINIIEKILTKTYFTSISESVFIKTERKGGATPELMPLLNARIAVISEIDENEKLNSKRLKALTGNDCIQARELYQSEITFQTQAKLVMLTNNKPDLDTTEQAIINRVKFLPFNQYFEASKENNDYVKSLDLYLDEFFTFFAIGAYEWFKFHTLGECKIIDEGQKQYLDEIDTVQQFIGDNCTLGAPNGVGPILKIKSSDFFNSYRDYCCSNNVNFFDIKKLKKAMTQKGFKHHKNNFTYWIGITIKQT